jgi:hypothetical protein
MSDEIETELARKKSDRNFQHLREKLPGTFGFDTGFQCPQTPELGMAEIVD